MVTSRAGAGVERASQVGDAQMPTWGDQVLRRVFPSLELTTATYGAGHQRRQMRRMMRLQARTRQKEFELRRQCSVEDAARTGGSLVIFVRQKGITCGIVPCWQRSCKLEATHGWRAMTMVADVPLELVHEQVSKEQSPGNGLAEGAVKELQVKIRTLKHSTEMGLGRRIPETHDSLAWVVTHAAATINWFRPGLDGKTPYELRVGRKFRRPVAPWRQKVWWMSAQKHVSRISAESRWQEGIFLGILGGGVGASDYAIGTPDGGAAGPSNQDGA